MTNVALQSRRVFPDEAMIRGRIVGSLLFVFLGVYWPSRSTVDCRPIALTAPEPSGRHQLLPIIFLPGKGGNQIDAKVDRTALPDEGLPQCDRRLDRYRMWMDLWTFFKRQFSVLLVQSSRAPLKDRKKLSASDIG